MMTFLFSSASAPTSKTVFPGRTDLTFHGKTVRPFYTREHHATKQKYTFGMRAALKVL
jgi:hypothetical protein